jgi:hypothetical protein
MDSKNDSTSSPHAAAGELHMEQLNTGECWRLLQEASLARLAFVDENGDPEIYPVNIQTAHGAIVIRSADDRKTRASTTRPRLALEVDGGTLRVRWSVIAHATAEVIVDDADSPSPSSAAPSWFPGTKTQSIRLTVISITGRRFLLVAGARPARGVDGAVERTVSVPDSPPTERRVPPTVIPSFPPMGDDRRRLE